MLWFPPKIFSLGYIIDAKTHSKRGDFSKTKTVRAANQKQKTSNHKLSTPENQQKQQTINPKNQQKNHKSLV